MNWWSVGFPPAEKADRQARLRPSLFQERRLNAHGMRMPFANHVGAAFHGTGEVDVAVLRDAMSVVAARHEALRGTFHRDEQGYFQRVHTSMPTEVAFEDLTGLPGADAPAAVSRRLDHEQGRPFDLSTGPFLRARIERLADTRWVIAFTADHFVVDGESMRTILDEICALYNAAVKGEPLDLPPVEFHAVDVALWQRDRLSGAAGVAIVDHWAAMLAARPADAGRPEDPVAPLPPPDALTVAPASTGYATRVLPAGLSEMLGHAVAQHRASGFSVLAACYASALAAVSGHADIVFVTSLSGRCMREHAAVVGNFAHVAPVRIAGEPGWSLGDWIRAARAVLPGVVERRGMPLRDLFDGLRERGGRFVPLDRMAYFAESRATELDLCGLSTRHIQEQGGDALWWHSLWVHTGGQAARAELVYDEARRGWGVPDPLLSAFAAAVGELDSGSAEPESG